MATEKVYLRELRGHPDHGCDHGWAAPHHASDCPVYERWEDVEARLRALAPEPGSTGQED